MVNILPLPAVSAPHLRSGAGSGIRIGWLSLTALSDRGASRWQKQQGIVVR